MKKILLILFIFFHATAFAESYTPKSIPNIYNIHPTIYVANPDLIINADDELSINKTLSELEKQTTIEVAVVAVNSIGQADTRQFAHELFNYWKIGKVNLDNGLLILLVVDQREVVFETGYGLEGELPDVLCYKIQQQYMVPFLAQNNYSKGVLAGAQQVANLLGQHQDANDVTPLVSVPKESHTTFLSILSKCSLFIYIALGAVLITIILPRLTAGRDPVKRYRHTMNVAMILNILIFIFIPSLILFMLWMFFYRYYLTYKKILCPKCGKHHFKRVANNEYDKYLTDSEQFELKIKSVKIRLYRCQECQHVFPYKVTSSSYKLCNKCQTIASELTKYVVIKPASYSSSGKARECWRCLKCRNETANIVIIAKKVRSSSSSGSSGHSSSSSSSSSRGGGSSGGGGSRSRF